MTAKRGDQDQAPDLNGRRDDTAVMAYALRPANDPLHVPKEKKDEERMSLFWRVFGGTILSIVALVALTVFNNLMTNLSELRAELTRSNEARAQAVSELRTDLARSTEARADLLRKDEFNTRMTSNWDRVQSLQQQNNAQNATLTSLKTEIDGLKERLAKQATEAEAARKDVAGLELVKERLGLLAAELKAGRDEFLKLRADVDKNQAYDLERKERRDVQYRHVDEALKELQRGLQDCREKLARFEGQYAPPAAPAPKKGGNARTVIPAGGKLPADEPKPDPKQLPGDQK